MNEIKTSDITEVLEKIYKNESLRQSIVPLFISNPGMGKSSIITKFAKDKGVNIVELITSQMSPFEVSGICIPHHESGQMKYYNLDKLENLKDGDIIFFDELLNGNPVVLNACLTILEQRKYISGKPLPKVMIVAAANPQGQAPLTPQIKERFVWYYLKFERNSWINFMKSKYQITTSIGNKLCSLIENEDFTGSNFFTPRSIDKACEMIINNVKTPYSKSINTILSEFVSNPFDQTVELPNGRVLEKEEMISWLELVKIKNNTYETITK